MKRGDFLVAQVQILAFRKHRVNFGAFEFRIRYQTTNNPEGNVDNFRVFAEGFTNLEDTTENSGVDKAVNLALSLNVWTTTRIVLDVPADDTSQYWRFGVSLTSIDEQATNNLRIDSIFVYGVPDSFGDEVIDTKVITGLVPEADTVTDAGKVLQADGGWVTNTNSIGQTTEEAANSITPIVLTKLPGDVLRYDAKIDGTTPDTQAFQDALNSGHPAFCDKEGTANIAGNLIMNGFKSLRLNTNLNMERNTGSATTPLLGRRPPTGLCRRLSP